MPFSGPRRGRATRPRVAGAGGGTGPAASTSPAMPVSSVTGAGHGPLVWRKPDLRGTDAQQPPSANTNPTGNLRLAQARFVGVSGLIDHRTYFRRDLFGHLPWSTAGGDMEETPATFRIIDRGRLLGDFDLRISHAPRRIAHQNNVPTVLHWGGALGAIRAANVIGATLSFYGPDSSGIFTIEFS